MTLNDQFAFERLLQRIDDPQNRSVLVIIEDSEGTMDSAYRGNEGDQGMFILAFSLASKISDELYGNMSEQQKAGMRLVYPTMEQARELGLVPFKKRS